MLAKLGFSHIVNTAAVRFIESEQPHPKTGQERCRVTFVDGTTLLIDTDMDIVERAAGQIIPAPPGYSVIVARLSDTFGLEPWFATYPVVAFRAMSERHGYFMPLLPGGEPDGAWALIYPDGRCDAYWEQTHDNIEAFKASYRTTIKAQQ